MRATIISILATIMPVGAIARAGCDPQWDYFPSGFDMPVYSLGVYNGDLYVGGAFEEAHGEVCNSIARWELTQFDNLAAGLVTSYGAQLCNAIAEFDGSLVAGGAFVRAGGVELENLAVWSPNSWAALGDPEYFSSKLHSILVVPENGEDTLYVGGDSGVHRWTGSAWEFAGLPGSVRAMALFDDGAGLGLYCAMNSTLVRRDPVSGVWTVIGQANEQVLALAVWDDGSGEALYACGAFTSVSGVEALRIVKWDGSEWSPLGEGLNNYAATMTIWDDGSGERLWVGGIFTFAGGDPASRLASWDGASWAGTGATFNGRVNAILPFDDGTGDALWIGGGFGTVNGQDSQKIVRLYVCAASTCPGDVDGDGFIGFADLNAVVSSFNTFDGDPGYNAAADFDGDGDVDFADLNVVLSAFNQAC